MSGIKIAVGGKGGVGKTTVCAVLSQLFAMDGFDVLAVDADPNTNLCCAFGIPAENSPEPLINMKSLIADRTGTSRESIGAYFKLNPKVNDLPAKHWIEITENDSNQKFAVPLKLLVLGGIDQAGSGCACPEGAFLKALLTHTILQRQEMLFVDLAAGVEFMGRASIQGIDVLIIVVEPGSRSIETTINIARMGKQLGIKKVVAIANKITDLSQVEIIEAQLQETAVIAAIEYNPAIQAVDLSRRNVFCMGDALVTQLEKAKDVLADLVLPDMQAENIK